MILFYPAELPSVTLQRLAEISLIPLTKFQGKFFFKKFLTLKPHLNLWQKKEAVTANCPYKNPQIIRWILKNRLVKYVIALLASTLGCQQSKLDGKERHWRLLWVENVFASFPGGFCQTTIHCSTLTMGADTGAMTCSFTPSLAGINVIGPINFILFPVFSSKIDLSCQY